MLQLEMSAEESELLRKILESHLADLRVEIARIDIEEFRVALKREEALVENLLPRLEHVLPSGNRFGEYAHF